MLALRRIAKTTLFCLLTSAALARTEVRKDRKQSRDVLVIATDASHDDSRYVSLALKPGKEIDTGVMPREEKPVFLADNDLKRYAIVYLVDIDSLSDQAVANLEGYVRDGGRVVMYLGERTDADKFNQTMYRKGKGLVPFALRAWKAAPEADRLRGSGLHVPPSEHPVAKYFHQEVRREYVAADFGSCRVDHYWQIDGPPPAKNEPTKKAEGPAAYELLHLRDGTPLLLDVAAGKGRVMAFLTAPGAADLHKRITWVVLHNEMKDYLLSDGRKQVGIGARP